jgi:hypothetical protein
MTPEDLTNRFIHHPPVDDHRAHQHALVRENCLEIAEWFLDALPEGREQSLAVTKLEEAMFWANAALARTP